MNIFIRELRANRKALIIWSLCIFLLVIGGMSKYTAYSSGASSEIFNEMPHTLKAMIGIADFDVTHMSGFFAFLFLYMEITAAVHAALLGSGIVAKEERDKTVEFLMVKAVSRNTILAAKLLAALFNLIVINLVTFLSSVTMVSAYNTGKDITGEIATFMFSMFFVQLIFLSIGALLAAFLKKPKLSGTIAAGILFMAYIISVVSELSEHLSILNILSPFKYFSYQKIVNGNGLHVGIVLISLLIFAAFTCTAFYAYTKRDLRT